MRKEERFNWWMPPNVWSKKPYQSRWKMSREEAAKHGATEPVEGTREVTMVPETEEERSRVIYERSHTGAAKPGDG